MRKYGLRNSLIPVVTFLGADLGALLGGAVITEGIFNLPGIGQQLYASIRLQETAVVVGFVDHHRDRLPADEPAGRRPVRRP